MSYYPNRLVLEAGHRFVVEKFGTVPGLRLALRPARKRLFTNEPEVPTLQVELSKPAFAALVPAECPYAQPLMVFETDNLSAGIKDLYRTHGIPFVEADQFGGRGALRFERPGFSAKISFDERGSQQATDTLLQWVEPSEVDSRGCLIRNSIERDVTDALRQVCTDTGLAMHHHVPFGCAAGYRPDLPREIARHTVEMTLAIHPDSHPAAPVVLPVRIERETESTSESRAIDRSLADFVCTSGMPMAAVQADDNGGMRVTYSMDGSEAAVAAGDGVSLKAVLGRIVSHASGLAREAVMSPATA